jgi:hypothetical protein
MAGPAADALAANIAGCYLLHELLASVKLPLDELSSAHLVAIEIPPVAVKGFEHRLLHLIAKIRAIGPHVAIIVQPSLRRQTQHALWIHRWNKMDARPFQFVQTCSCKMGNQCHGCHFPLLCGSTFLESAELATCTHVSTSGAQPLTLQRSLTGALLAFCALLLSSGDYISSRTTVANGEIVMSEPEPRHLGDYISSRTVVTNGEIVIPGSQRTPDSLTHCTKSSTLTKTLPQTLPQTTQQTTTTTTAFYPTNTKEGDGRNERETQEEASEITTNI